MSGERGHERDVVRSVARRRRGQIKGDRKYDQKPGPCQRDVGIEGGQIDLRLMDLAQLS